MNEIVKYDNYMNSLRFSGFSPVDYNFLMVLCNKLRDKNTTEIIISFDELREKTGYTQHPIKQFVSDIMRMNNKLMKMSCALEKDGTIYQFVLFPTFATDTVNKRLIVAVNEKFKFILNDITNNFTRFELEQFIKIESKYAKNLYRLLKQYRTAGNFEVSLSDFREKMDCPESYTNKHVMDKIIKPSLKELQGKGYFQNLQCKTKYARKPGRPVMGYIFTFNPEIITYRPGNGQVREEKSRSNKSRKITNSFNNFEQRTYDYEELERKLLGNND